MTRFLLVAVSVAGLVTACDRGGGLSDCECSSDSDCDQAQLCDGCRCTSDNDCLTSEVCDTSSHTCIPRGADADTDVDSDVDSDTRPRCPDDEARLACSVDDDCDIGWYCEEGCCSRIILCSSDEDCAELGEGAACTLGVCRPLDEGVCQTDEDCGECCACVHFPNRCECNPYCCQLVRRVRITTPHSTTRTGMTRQFNAQAFDSRGQILPGQHFRWVSSNPEAASIDPDTGLATGGAEEGRAQITAELACEEGKDR